MCDDVTPDPVLDGPSPNAHAYDATDPSGSDDPDPSKEHTNNAHDAENDATGTWFGGGVPPPVGPATTSSSNRVRGPFVAVPDR